MTTSYLGTLLLTRLPFIVIWLVAAVLALVTWRRNPLPSLLTLIGTLLAVPTAAAGIAVGYWLVRAREMGMSQEEYGAIQNVVLVASVLVSCVAYSLLVAAVFVGRSPRVTAPAPYLPP
jgi:hypothetical protein